MSEFVPCSTEQEGYKSTSKSKICEGYLLPIERVVTAEDTKKYSSWCEWSQIYKYTRSIGTQKLWKCSECEREVK